MEAGNVATAGLKDRLFGLEEKAFERLYAKSLILTSEWAKEDLETLVTLAETFEALDRRRIKTPLFSEELAYAVFFDNSTRTKSAWAGAAARLGMHPVIVDGSSTQVSHGETAVETGAMLGMNAHALGIRHDKILGECTPFIRDMHRGIQQYLRLTNDDRQVPMVNLQCDTDHPTQCMADLVWLKEYFGGELKGKKVAVTWAYSPSYAKPLSVPQGLITLLPRFGVDVTLAHPKGYDLSEDCLAAARKGAKEGGGSFAVADSMSEAFTGAHAVYPKSWGPRTQMLQKVEANRAGDSAALDRIEKECLEHNAKFKDWICDADKMALTENALYMHCLPADPGAEVTREILSKFQTQVSRQANKKVYVIMALLAAAKSRGLWGRLLQILD
jgi:knotted carbamoyltransferase YgeW